METRSLNDTNDKMYDNLQYCFPTVLIHRMSYQHGSYKLITITLKLYSIHSYTDVCGVLKSLGHTGKPPKQFEIVSNMTRKLS